MDNIVYYSQVNTQNMLLAVYKSDEITFNPSRTDFKITVNGDTFIDRQLQNDFSQYLYKYENGYIVPRTQEELDLERLPEIKADKKAEISSVCSQKIIQGVEVNGFHYSMTIEDQANILAWIPVTQAGQSVPYHADGQPCRIYSAEEFTEIANAVIAHKTYHTTYCNLLMRQIENMTDIAEIKAVRYGITELTDEYAEIYKTVTASLIGDNDEND